MCDPAIHTITCTLLKPPHPKVHNLYREIWIGNTLVSEKGKEVKLKEGAEVDVIVEANPNDTIPK